MKKNDVEAGKVYRVKVSGSVQDVRITGENPHGGWDGVNVATKRKVRIKSAQRLRAVAGERPAKRKKVVSLAEYEADAKGSSPAADVGPGAEKPAKATKDAKPAPKRDTGEPDANDGEPKRMSIMSAAVKVLEERDPADGPLTCPQMLERMTAKGYWSPARGGKTPANTLYAAILREINTKGEASRFDKVERGKFSLSLKR
ncbi:MAG TPA: winged helix-turn-helix domain-containing protein [Phycisphaerae bacterium]|nr:winged helix-turn-helix domain-containing protein [Phycisphaerae bacterium]